MLAEQTPGFD